MDSTKTPRSRQALRQAKNYPATTTEALAMLRTSALPNYQPVTIGETLDAMVNRTPKPLSAKFLERFAATAASEPIAVGRIIRHALTESRRAADG